MVTIPRSESATQLYEFLELVEFAELWVCVTTETKYVPVFLKGSSLGGILYKMEVPLAVASHFTTQRAVLYTYCRAEALDLINQLIAEERLVKFSLFIS